MTFNHPPAERPILQKVETGLKQAIEDDSDLDWPEGGKGTRIRRQKYTEQAVSYFTKNDPEPVLTSSWYKFGITYPAAPSGANFGDGQFPSPNLRESEIFEASPSDIAHFFSHIANKPSLDGKHWYMSSLDFLEKFYRIHAPEDYRELYIQNIELRRIFEDTTLEISSLRESQTDSATSLSDFGSDTEVDYYKRAGRTASRMHMELATIPELEASLDPVREFTDLLEDVLMQLAKIEQSELKSRHRSAIEALEEFYNKSVWEYPAAVIMKETVVGPNSDWVVNNADKKLKALRSSYSDDLKQLRQTCREAGLLPTPQDYPAQNDGISSATIGMMRTVDRMNEQ